MANFTRTPLLDDPGSYEIRNPDGVLLGTLILDEAADYTWRIFGGAGRDRPLGRCAELDVGAKLLRVFRTSQISAEFLLASGRVDALHESLNGRPR